MPNAASQNPTSTPPLAPVAPASAPSVGAMLAPGLLGRALLCGASVVAAATAVAFASGMLPKDSGRFVGSGVAAALVAVGLALLLHGRFLDRRATESLRGDPRLVAGRLQSLLAAAFGLKLAMLMAGVLILRGLGVKFDELAAFAVAFAAAALLCQVAAAGFVARALARASASRGPSVRSGIPERSGVPGGSPQS